MVIRSVFFVAFALCFSISSATKTCDRKPTGISSPKSTSSNPFRIVFKGNSEFYSPGKTYTGNISQYVYSLKSTSYGKFVFHKSQFISIGNK